MVFWLLVLRRSRFGFCWGVGIGVFVQDVVVRRRVRVVRVRRLMMVLVFIWIVCFGR